MPPMPSARRRWRTRRLMSEREREREREREPTCSQRGCCVVVKSEMFFSKLEHLYRHLGSPHLHNPLHSMSRSTLWILGISHSCFKKIGQGRHDGMAHVKQGSYRGLPRGARKEQILDLHGSPDEVILVNHAGILQSWWRLWLALCTLVLTSLGRRRRSTRSSECQPSHVT
jgi:hypothetical protein